MVKFITKDMFEQEDEYRIACKIQQRRLQILVHSYIYYELNDNVISDDKWSLFAKELCILQKSFPDIAKKVPYDKIFKDFDGSTGMNLKYDKWVKEKAKFILSYKK